MPYPGLVVSRSFGDDVAKRLGVVPEPEVVVHKLPSKSKYVIVLGTDGVWDGITPDEAVLIASGQPTAEKASNELTKKSKEALDRICIDDNTTNVIVFADPA
jgi:serine/threonine protein phosphatase PrpC